MIPQPPSVPDTADFSAEPLLASPENKSLIQEFVVDKRGKGLERYLKEHAAKDERANESRTYLVKDAVSGELACYFSLRSGLIAVESEDGLFDTIPAIELANFAVNDSYRAKNRMRGKIGAYVFDRFILPLTHGIASLVGVNCLYIFSLPDPQLISHYEALGFSRLPPNDEQFVHNHVRPRYDKGCIFMFQTLSLAPRFQ